MSGLIFRTGAVLVQVLQQHFTLLSRPMPKLSGKRSAYIQSLCTTFIMSTHYRVLGLKLDRDLGRKDAQDPWRNV